MSRRPILYRPTPRGLMDQAQQAAQEKYMAASKPFFERVPVNRKLRSHPITNSSSGTLPFVKPCKVTAYQDVETPEAPYWSPYTYNVILLDGSGIAYAALENRHQHSEFMTYKPATDNEAELAGFVYWDSIENSPYCYIAEQPMGIIHWGTPVSAFSSGTTISLQPVNVSGDDTFHDTVSPYMKRNQTSYSMYTGTTIPTTELVAYSENEDGELYVVGNQRTAVYDVRYNTTDHRDEAKYFDSWGLFHGTVSDWVTVRQYVSKVVMKYVSGPDGDGCYEVDTEVIWVPESQDGIS